MRDELGVLELPSREVDRHLQGTPVLLLERGAPCARLVQHPFPERDDQTRLLCERDELERTELTLGRVLPADERFVAGDLVRLEVDDRLVFERELTALERIAQLGDPARAL